MDRDSYNKEWFEHINCNLCGAGDESMDIIYEADHNRLPKSKEDILKIYSSSSSEVFYERLVRCGKCGLIFISPRIKRDLVIQGYSKAEDEKYVSQESGRMATFKNSVKKIKKYIQTGRLLDIGAASGIFVKAAKDEGFDAYGVEPSKWMCEFAKKHYDVEVYPGTLEEKNFTSCSFDVITMWDVLEHVPDPMATLKEAHRILKPGGYMIINYPNIDDPLAKIFGRKWWFLLSIHLFYFTEKTLGMYLQKLGLEKVKHGLHFQELEYGYLVERLNVYSKVLSNLAKIPFILPGFRKLLIPYFASQYIMIVRKKI